MQMNKIGHYVFFPNGSICLLFLILQTVVDKVFVSSTGREDMNMFSFLRSINTVFQNIYKSLLFLGADSLTSLSCSFTVVLRNVAMILPLHAAPALSLPEVQYITGLFIKVVPC